MHWTTENKMKYTRVSLDFRLIPGPVFEEAKCGGGISGGQRNVYMGSEGYYSCCQKPSNGEATTWIRKGPLLTPDVRVGFPFTVQDWGQFWKKHQWIDR
jgi:hypothetical protein